MPRKRKKRRRLPNGFGSIVEVGGNRYKPFLARRSAIKLPDGSSYREIVGYFETYEDALKALTNPYKIKAESVTFQDIFNMIVESNNFKAMTHNTQQRYVTNFAKLGSLRSEPIQEVTKSMLQAKIDEIERVGYERSGRRVRYSKDSMDKIISSLSIVYEYAVDDHIVPTNLTKNITTVAKEKDKRFKNFTLKEIDILFENSNIKEVKIILVNIFFGLRPIEMVNFQKEHCFFDKDIIQGMGGKTDTGRKRSVIIHPKIKTILADLYSDTDKYIVGEKMSTKVYRERIFKDTLSNLGILYDRTPYVCRDTFAYLMNHYNVDKETIKNMMGHRKYSTSSDNYIDFDVEKAKKEFKKIAL